jgi:signal peptidase II
LVNWLFIPLSLMVIAIDQFTKNLAIASLEPGILVPVLGDFLGWRLVFNDSAAFSIGFGQTWILAVFSSLAALWVIWFSRRITRISWQVMSGVFLGGVVGNLIDRLIREPSFGNGYVVDFLQIPFNFPVFNIADIAIVSIAILTVLRIFLGDNLGGLSGEKR